MLFALLVGSNALAVDLKDLRVVSTPGEAIVFVEIATPVPPQIQRLREPDRIVLDFASARPSPGLAASPLRFNSPIVNRIRYGRRPAGSLGLRLVIDLSANFEFDVSETNQPAGIQIRIHAPKPQPSAPGPRPGFTMPPPDVSPATQSIPVTEMPLIWPYGRLPLSGLAPPPLPPSPPNPAMAAGPVAPATVDSPAALFVSPLNIPRVSQAPTINTFLEGRPREAEALVSQFRQRLPRDGAPVSQPTQAFLSYDDKNLYVIFECMDDPEKIRARLSKREDIDDDDTVSVYLDTFSDRQRAYQFTANPLGIQKDSTLTEGQKADARFDTLWFSEGRVLADRYLVWMAIPFKSLRFTSEPNQTWRIALGRSIPRTNEVAFWPALSMKQAGFVTQFAEASGIRDVSGGRNIQLIPYFTATGARPLDWTSGRYPAQTEFRGGLDAKIVIKNSLTLDLTALPDFSQVESDDPQVTVNQRFEVFFPDKRPFFIENAAYFQTPINLFFSRRIIEPRAGARLTGKVGRWALGFLGIDDQAPGKLQRQDSPNFLREAVAGVARVQREFGKDSYVGGIITSREFGNTSNHVASLDSRLRLSTNWFATGQVARSSDRSSDGRQNEGQAVLADITHTGRNFFYTGNFLDISPEFRAPLGFVRRTDVRQNQHYGAYFWRPEGGKVLSFGPSVTAGWNWNHAGQLQDWYTNADFSIDFAGPSGFKVARYEAYELYLARGYRYARTDASFYSGILRWLYLYGSFGLGSGVNYNPAWGLSPETGRARNGSFGFNLRPTKRVRLEEYYFYSWLGTRATNGTSIFTNHLLRTKLNYQFTRALSLRGIVDYYTLLPDSTQVNESKTKQFIGDVLLTYLIHPGTALHLGYNRRYLNLSADPEGLAPVTFGGPRLGVLNSQVFLKLSYLVRF